MYRKEKKIPTILALFILFLGISGIVYLEKNTYSLSSVAKTTPTPEDIHFTNITGNSFTISWLTSEQVTGIVEVSDGLGSITLLDDLDSDNVSRPRLTHYITAKNLKENTSYKIKIISGDPHCSDQKQCPTFTQKTATELPLSSSLPPAHGTIVTETNQPADGTIVYLVIEKSLPLSGRADTAGLWAIPLNNLRSQDILSTVNLSDNDIVQITAKLSPSQTTEALIDVKSIRQNFTIPPMQIGKSYNFIELISKKDLLASLKDQRTLGIQTELNTTNNSTLDATTNKKIEILFPAEEGDRTIDNRPRIRGTGPPGKHLLITVKSVPQNAKLTIDADGNWVWRPPHALPPGTHYVSIQEYDDTGNIIMVKRKFVVLKSGERVLGEATASATLTPTMTPTTTAIPTPGIATPTPSSSPTTTVTPTMGTATPTVSSPPATISVTPPPTGISQPILILLGGGLTLLLLGTKLFLTL